jgi:hypothetical protein
VRQLAGMVGISEYNEKAVSDSQHWVDLKLWEFSGRLTTSHRKETSILRNVTQDKKLLNLYSSRDIIRVIK